MSVPDFVPNGLRHRWNFYRDLALAFAIMLGSAVAMMMFSVAITMLDPHDLTVYEAFAFILEAIFIGAFAILSGVRWQERSRT